MGGSAVRGHGVELSLRVVYGSAWFGSARAEILGGIVHVGFYTLTDF